MKVVARCGCGKCPTILFGKSFEYETQTGNLKIDYLAKGKNEELIGVMIFGNEKMPFELEFYSIDGEFDITEIPNIETLKPLIENQ